MIVGVQRLDLGYRLHIKLYKVWRLFGRLLGSQNTQIGLSDRVLEMTGRTHKISLISGHELWPTKGYLIAPFLVTVERCCVLV